MTRLLILCVVCTVGSPVWANDPPPPLAESFLHDGRFAEGETALLLALDAHQADDEARFGLGAIQFMRAVENLGRVHQAGACELLIFREFACRLSILTPRDFANSREASATEYTEASLWFRLAVRAARLLAPVQ